MPGRQGRPKNMTTDERFWEKVGRTDDTSACWEWLGGRVGQGPFGGYGRFATSTTRGSVVLVLAHRYSFERHYFPVPDGFEVIHACDNPACVNPAHLMVGPHSANMRDAKAKGRTRGRNAA